MSSLLDLIVRLERRVFILEVALGIVADKADFTHPKAQIQAEFIASELATKLLGEIK